MSDKQVNISKYLDSTFLKTSGELGVSNSELEILVTNFINEAIDYDFKCINSASISYSIIPGLISGRILLNPFSVISHAC